MALTRFTEFRIIATGYTKPTSLSRFTEIEILPATGTHSYTMAITTSLAISSSYTRTLDATRSISTSLALDTDVAYGAVVQGRTFTSNLALTTELTSVSTLVRSYENPLAISSSYSRHINTTRIYDNDLTLGTDLAMSLIPGLFITQESTYYSNTSKSAAIARLDDTYVLLSYVDDSDDLYLRVAETEVNGESSYGTPYLIDSNTKMISMCGMSSTRAVVLYEDLTTNEVYARVVSISNRTITGLGFEVDLFEYSSVSYRDLTVKKLDTDKVVFAWVDYYPIVKPNYFATVKVYSISDTTLTGVTGSNIDIISPAQDYPYFALDIISSSKILVVTSSIGQDSENNAIAAGSAQLLTFSSNTITNEDSCIFFLNTGSDNVAVPDIRHIDVSVMSTSKAMVTYSVDPANTTDGTQKRYASMLDLTSTTVSSYRGTSGQDFDSTNGTSGYTPVAIDSSADTDARVNMCRASSNQSYVLYTDTSACILKIKLLTNNINTIEVGEATILNTQASSSSSPAMDRNGIIQIDGDKVGVAFVDPGDSFKAKVIFIGFNGHAYLNQLTPDSDFTRGAISYARSYTTSLAVDSDYIIDDNWIFNTTPVKIIDSTGTYKTYYNW